MLIHHQADQSHGRWSLDFDGREVFADYRRDGAGALLVLHVEADPALRGSGAAGAFMTALVDWARTEGERLRPRCSYAVHWLSRHPQAADVLADG